MIKVISKFNYLINKQIKIKIRTLRMKNCAQYFRYHAPIITNTIERENSVCA